MRKVYVNWLEPCENCNHQGAYVPRGDEDYLFENDDVVCAECGHHGIIQTEPGLYRDYSYVVWDAPTVKIINQK
ncbi:hypothetical protein JSY31_01695 [Xenorhabdus bovienii]|uniref:Uncharacterized protein n=1 Tax=Xenorhabdus bovienii TaxID=40576 RepID=A0A0B6XD15_XENBV|nr:hypothetical protein [Xenorhabdus bovienii]CDM91076.1 protein of unknown function [Xenorhabdus bovienii]